MPTTVSSVWSAVIGQQRAIAQLAHAAVDPVHAYLFVGPPGCTKDEAARGFAALILAGTDDPAQRDARLALLGEHPDVREVERVGANISKDQVTEIVRSAALAPIESSRKVLILHEFHLLDSTGAARLLKTLEEPPPSTVFIVLADQVPPDLITIASRCVRIEFSGLTADAIADALTAEGIDTADARQAADAAGGDMGRARVLAHDSGLVARRAAFASVPSRLDGTGSMVSKLCTELLGLIDDAAAPLVDQQAQEIAVLEARVAALGERGSGRKQLEDRHKRELRRHRIDEIRSGLAVIAGTYRDALVAGSLPRPDAAATAISRIHRSLEALERNPNELLMLQALLLDLPTV